MTSRPYVRVHPTAPSRQSSGDSTKDGAYGSTKHRKPTLIEKLKSRYQYDKIKEDHTRVLMVNPRPEDGERIDVSISEVPFEQLGTEVHYEALSYHWDYGWNSDEQYKPIHIRNDQDRMLAQQAMVPGEPVDVHLGRSSLRGLVEKSMMTKKMFVKPNLYHALRNLRRNTKPVWLWVDALCINQDDLEEKHNQIARMNVIYSKADSVLVWLGDGDERTKRAMSFIKEIIDLKHLKDLVSNDARIDHWDDLIHLMRRSWFSRRWVIQELAFASNATVHCGNDKVHWNDFRDAISIFDHELDRIRPLFKRSDAYDNNFWAIGDLDPLGAKVLVDMINNIFRKSKRGRGYEPMKGLEYLVSKLSSYDSGDPRDTIHAFSNVAKDTFRRSQVQPASASGTTHQYPPPQVDYKKTLLQVYSDFVSWVAVTTGSIDIICRHWAIPEKTKSSANDNYPRLSALPSWIQQISEGPFGSPKKSSKGRINGDSFVGLPGHKTYDACHGRLAIVRFSCDRVLSDRASRTKPTTSVQDVPRVHGPDGSTIQMDNLNSVPLKPNGAHSRKRSRDEDAGAGADCDIRMGKYSRRDAATQMKGSLPQSGLDVLKASEGGRSPNTPRTPQTPRPEDGDDSDTSSSSNVSRSSSVSSAPSDDFEKAEESVIQQIIVQRRDASMYVDGMILGTVGYCTDPIPDGVIPQRAVGKLKKASRQEDPDKLWRTLVAERGDYGRNPEPWYERACAYCVTHHNSNGHINTKDLLASTSQPEHVQKFLKRVQGVIWNRCFIEIESSTPASTTVEGEYKHAKMHGFGSSRAQTGDLLCILFGCSVPVILRRRQKPEIGEYFLFIGEAYVYGIMDGEAVSSLSEQEIEECTETFRLL